VSEPNVLLVVFDTARRDALEPYGAPVGSSPVVADLARSGRAFKRVYATASWTVPSHASMLTGLMPRAAGLSAVRNPADVRIGLRAHRDRLLQTVMRRAGYTTASASANLWLSKVTGFDAGFDDFTEIETDRNAQIHLDSPRERFRWYWEAAKAQVDDGAQQVLVAVKRWATRPDRRPFFGFVNLLECHSPYLPPRPYGGRQPLARLQAARDARRYYTLAGIWRACAGVEPVPEAVLARAQAFYRESIRYMDSWLGEVLQTLDEQRVLQDTLVIVLADHGENFGEGGLIGHTLSLDERLIRVPLIASGPGTDALGLASLVSLPRKLADVCGIEGHPWTDGPPDDVAIAQFDPPASAGDEPRLAKLRSAGIDGEALERFVTPLTCAVKNDLKLIREGGEERVYDLAADPGEVAPLRPDQLAGARQRQLEELRGVIGFGAAPSADAHGPTPAIEGPSEQEVRDLEERMKLLGYM
jgi:arylsulfatase A-like enzyme